MRRVITFIIASLLVIGVSVQTSSIVMDGMKAVSEHYGVNFAHDSNLPVDTFFKEQDFFSSGFSPYLAGCPHRPRP